MSEVKRTDLKEYALDLLLPQFKGKPNIESVLLGPTKVLQTNLDTMFDISKSLDLDNAEGEQLSVIGRLLNVPRNGKSDLELKKSIDTKIIINRATGTGESLIDTLTSLVGKGKFSIIESFPAEVQVRLFETQDILNDEIINAILPLGVNGVFFQNPYTGKTVWETSNISNNQNNANSVLPDVADLDTTIVVIADVIFT